MAEATYRYPSGIAHYPNAPAGTACGQVVQKGGLAGVVQGLSVAEGEDYSVAVEGQFDVASASGTTFTEGVTVGWDDTANLAVAGGAGDFDIGKAAKAKVSGELVVLVNLNK